MPAGLPAYRPSGVHTNQSSVPRTASDTKRRPVLASCIDTPPLVAAANHFPFGANASRGTSVVPSSTVQPCFPVAVTHWETRASMNPLFCRVPLA
jgi:hypothetical protein